MASPEEFNRRMGRLGAEVARGADRIVREVAVAAAQTVIVATPVDTGRARSNWLASVVGARRDTIDPLAEGQAATGPSISAARAVIGSYNGDTHREVTLSNNLAYIGRLNDGYSAQAPAGFVRLAVQAAVDAVQGARLLP